MGEHTDPRSISFSITINSKLVGWLAAKLGISYRCRIELVERHTGAKRVMQHDYLFPGDVFHLLFDGKGDCDLFDPSSAFDREGRHSFFIPGGFIAFPDGKLIMGKRKEGK